MNIPHYNEVIVYIARHTGWSLEYIRGMPIHQLQALTDELAKQEAAADYKRDYPIALLITALAQGKVTVEDIIGPMPGQIEEAEDIWILAEEAGIKVPSQRT